jgi:hypothetical protein
MQKNRIFTGLNTHLRCGLFVTANTLLLAQREWATMIIQHVIVELDVAMDAAEVTTALRNTADLMSSQAAVSERGTTQINPKLVIGNFDNDTRDLQNIPEAAAFFRLVVECGWYGLVHLPKALGMLPALQPGCSAEEEQEFWTPILIGYCPDGLLQPSNMSHLVLASCKAFSALHTRA